MLRQQGWTAHSSHPDTVPSPTCLAEPSDYQLARACEDEAARLCGAARGAAGDASVFRCLVGVLQGGSSSGGLSGGCAAEVARTARTGLDFYEQASVCV